MSLNTKKIVIFCSCLVVSAMAGFVGTQAFLFWLNQDEARLRLLVPEVQLNPDSVFSESHDRDIMRLYNQVGRKMRWSDEDRNWVADIIGSGWPDIPLDPQDPELDETWMLFNSTLTIIGERMSFGIETDETVAELYEETVVGLLDHPQSRLRSRGVTALANAGMLSNPEYLKRLESMLQTETDPGVIRSLKIKLDQHAGLETAYDDCPTCPGKEP